MVDGQRRIRADPPLLVPVADLAPDLERERLQAEISALLARYGRTLQSDRRRLLERFTFVDMAHKVVGVGSVGTRCWVVLLEGRDEDDVLFLQVKEAQQSALVPYLPHELRPRRRPANEGQRVVNGQHLMQAASDIFLGWDSAVGRDGVRRDFYVRQLRDQKGSVPIEGAVPEGLRMYGEACGWTLARAHARSGDSIAITEYLGADDTFPKAVARFSERYADQNDRDHAALVEAAKPRPGPAAATEAAGRSPR